MPFTWFEPEQLLTAAGWLPSGMTSRSRTSDTERARLSELTREMNAAREACPDCNHSGYRIVDGRILDCHCVAPFRLAARPLSPGTTGGV